ncbi:hypothetical protein KKJ10_01895 [Xenorhabdus bovienii]|uniref:Uncharacterized protein n=1 Tax=Xenorhabdus bovienii TaxID=40576 RepID=A0AAJ1MYC4_XENBV|nr:hypothetical protein [Xenorhabdus bovienii]MDE1477760.1 hypothetical protein [Xenorhabdus bovienii]MDE9472317.1 hypothetical protein [Xenorhabdus bovienii]MDE9475635.1 hypothetical protein [Xenorhabdus bovienii]MDE9505075.1 hypothetical protein [Xenorhabdus bovienii]MDE9509500.1 hypothetical protein [Xenorhabdus bovienii]
MFDEPRLRRNNVQAVSFPLAPGRVFSTSSCTGHPGTEPSSHISICSGVMGIAVVDFPCRSCLNYSD